MRCLPAAFLILAAGAGLAAETLTPAEYHSRLKTVLDRMEGGDMASASAEAAALLDARVRFGEELIHPDPGVLGPIAERRDRLTHRVAAERLRVLLDALEKDLRGARERPIRTHPEVMLRLKNSLEDRRPAEGGEVAGFPVVDLPFSDWLMGVISQWLLWAVDSAWRVILALLNLLLELLFGRRGGGTTGFDIGRAVTIAIVTLAIVAAVVIAVHLIRNRPSRAYVTGSVSSSGVTPGKDDDVLSRTATEWERYAAKLAADGRFRESIRAWYHAILVTMFRAGRIPYRRGRTNWEYVNSIPYLEGWRPAFVEAVRVFEREWYGRFISSPETADDYAARASSLLAAVSSKGSAMGDAS